MLRTPKETNGSGMLPVGTRVSGAGPARKAVRRKHGRPRIPAPDRTAASGVFPNAGFRISPAARRRCFVSGCGPLRTNSSRRGSCSSGERTRPCSSCASVVSAGVLQARALPSGSQWAVAGGAGLCARAERIAVGWLARQLLAPACSAAKPSSGATSSLVRTARWSTAGAPQKTGEPAAARRPEPPHARAPRASFRRWGSSPALCEWPC